MACVAAGVVHRGLVSGPQGRPHGVHGRDARDQIRVGGDAGRLGGRGLPVEVGRGERVQRVVGRRGVGVEGSRGSVMVSRWADGRPLGW